ncbi:MAG: hypothetical protein MRY76_04005 [Pseudomonadales bacterium]|nr:hypothetical protein [Pseudomonadales bacterium]
MANPDKSREIPTLDGKRTRVDQLNLGTAQSPDKTEQVPAGGLKRLFYRLNQVLAGMYTGLTCYGTPHSHRREAVEGDEESEKPDVRPL